MRKGLLTLASRIREEISEIGLIINRIQGGWERTKQSGDEFFLDSVALNFIVFIPHELQIISWHCHKRTASKASPYVQHNPVYFPVGHLQCRKGCTVVPVPNVPQVANNRI